MISNGYQSAVRFRGLLEAAEQRIKELERENANITAMHKRILAWAPDDVQSAKTVLLQFAAKIAREGGDGKRAKEAIDALGRYASKCKDEADTLEAFAESVRDEARKLGFCPLYHSSSPKNSLAFLVRQLGMRENDLRELQEREEE